MSVTCRRDQSGETVEAVSSHEHQRFVVRFVALLPRLLVDLVLRLVAPLRADFDALVRLATDFFEALLADFLAALGVDFFGAAFFVALAGFLVPLL